MKIKFIQSAYLDGVDYRKDEIVNVDKGTFERLVNSRKPVAISYDSSIKPVIENTEDISDEN